MCFWTLLFKRIDREFETLDVIGTWKPARRADALPLADGVVWSKNLASLQTHGFTSSTSWDARSILQKLSLT